MAQKTTESDWEEAEQLGPYQLHEQMTQSEDGGGQLFRATHGTTGATALVLKPPETPGEAGAETDWQVRYASSGTPRFVSMEVERSPWSFSPHKHSAEELVFLFEGLQRGVKQMARHVPGAEEPRGRRALGLGLAFAGAALMGALLFALVPSLLSLREPEVQAAQGLDGDESSTDAMEVPLVKSLRSMVPGDSLMLTRAVPKQPYKGQAKPPCLPKVEVELQGGCWVPHKLKAPCPPELHEHQGECYTPSYPAQPPPQSVGK